MATELNEKEVSLLVDGMRAGIELWGKMVTDAKEGGMVDHPLVQMLEDQIVRATALKAKLVDAEQIMVS